MKAGDRVELTILVKPLYYPEVEVGALGRVLRVVEKAGMVEVSWDQQEDCSYCYQPNWLRVITPLEELARTAE